MFWIVLELSIQKMGRAVAKSGNVASLAGELPQLLQLITRFRFRGAAPLSKSPPSLNHPLTMFWFGLRKTPKGRLTRDRCEESFEIEIAKFVQSPFFSRASLPFKWDMKSRTEINFCCKRTFSAITLYVHSFKSEKKRKDEKLFLE